MATVVDIIEMKKDRLRVAKRRLGFEEEGKCINWELFNAENQGTAAAGIFVPLELYPLLSHPLRSQHLVLTTSTCSNDQPYDSISRPPRPHTL